VRQGHASKKIGKGSPCWPRTCCTPREGGRKGGREGGRKGGREEGREGGREGRVDNAPPHLYLGTQKGKWGKGRGGGGGRGREEMTYRKVK